MPATLTAAQLLSALTEQQVEAVETYWSTAAGQADPVAEEIASALARVDAYTGGWAPAGAMLTAWARDLAAWAVLKRVNLVEETHTTARQTAIDELEAVREGRFPGIARAANPLAGQVAHGSRPPIR